MFPNTVVHVGPKWTTDMHQVRDNARSCDTSDVVDYGKHPCVGVAKKV
jgi:hypothetical protein